MKNVLLLCRAAGNYKGLERSVPYSSEFLSTKTIKQILELTDNDGDIPLSDDNFLVLQAIKSHLLLLGVHTDIIIVSQSEFATNAKSVVFLGFDVSGDSLWHSPIFRAFYEAPYNLPESISVFKTKLNANGLFALVQDANAFAVSANNNMDFFECDNHLRPIKIFGIE